MKRKRPLCRVTGTAPSPEAQTDKPRRPKTAIQLFALKFQGRAKAIVAKQLKGTVRVVHDADKARMMQAVLVKMWKAMTPKQQAPYTEAAEAAFQRYKEVCEHWVPPDKRPFLDSTGRIYDPRAPRRPKSAYSIFLEQFRARYEKETGTGPISFPEVAMAAQKAWQSLAPVEMLPFKTQAKAEREEYEARMAGYVPPTVQEVLDLNPLWDENWKALGRAVQANAGLPLDEGQSGRKLALQAKASTQSQRQAKAKQRKRQGGVDDGDGSGSEAGSSRQRRPKRKTTSKARAKSRKEAAAEALKLPAPLPGIGVPSEIGPWMDQYGIVHDPAAPAPPQDAQAHFAKAALAEMNASGDGGEAAARVMAEFWASMSAQEKEPFVDMERQDADRYERELTSYTPPDPTSNPVWAAYLDALFVRGITPGEGARAAEAKYGVAKAVQAETAPGGEDGEEEEEDPLAAAARAMVAATGFGIHSTSYLAAPSRGSGSSAASQPPTSSEDKALLREWKRALAQRVKAKKAELAKPKAPTKPRSAFAVFMGKVKEGVRAAFAEMGEGEPSKEEVAAEIKDMWEQLDEEDKNVYQVLYRQMASDYTAMQSQYKASLATWARLNEEWAEKYGSLPVDKALAQEMIVEWNNVDKAVPASVLAKFAADGELAHFALGGEGGAQPPLTSADEAAAAMTGMAAGTGGGGGGGRGTKRRQGGSVPMLPPKKARRRV